MASVLKRVCFWPARVKNDVAEFPEEVRGAIYQALQDAKLGFTSSYAKAHGEDPRLAKVMKIVKNAGDGNTYRGIYTVEFDEAIWVIDAYEKRSTSGISTPRADIERTVRRLKDLRRYRGAEGAPHVKALQDELDARRAKAQQTRDDHHGNKSRRPRGR